MSEPNAMTKQRFNLRHLAQLASLVTPLLLGGTLATSLVLPSTGYAADSATPAVGHQVRPLADFQGLELLTSADVSVRPGATQSVTVRADDNLQAQLETVVEDRRGTPTLVVRWKRGTRIHGHAKVNLDLVVTSLRAVQVSGAGDVTLTGFSVPSLRLGVSGSGDITAQTLSADDLQVQVAGRGDVRANGSAKLVSVSVAGSGDVRLADLRAEDAKVHIAGSGDVAVQAHRELDVSIVGSGDVVYSGDAKVRSQIVGSGSVSRR